MASFTTCAPMRDNVEDADLSCSVCMGLMRECKPEVAKITLSPMEAYFKSCVQPFSACMKLKCHDYESNKIRKMAGNIAKVQRAFTQFKTRVLKIQMMGL